MYFTRIVKWIQETFAADIIKDRDFYKEELKSVSINEKHFRELSMHKDKIIEDLTNDIDTHKFQHAISSVSDLFEDEDLRRTQSDKPSAHSSLSFEKAHNLIKMTFPEPNYRVFSVSNTNSMEPFLDYNSLIIAEKIRYSVLKKQPLGIGDIAIYEATIRGKFIRIIHRIVKINKEKELYYFLGDNNYSADGWIPLKNIKYRFVGTIQTLRLREND